MHSYFSNPFSVHRHLPPHLHVIKDSLFSPPIIFRLIQHGTTTPTTTRIENLREMYNVYNMGHRMEVYIDEKNADLILSIANELGLPAQIVGRVVPASVERGGGGLTIRTPCDQKIDYKILK